MRHFIIIALLFIARLSQAQLGMGEVKGEIYDVTYEEPLAFANVVLMINGEVKAATQTDFDGKFVIKPVPPGQYILQVNFAGLVDYEMTEIMVNADKITFLPRIEVRSYEPEPWPGPIRGPVYQPSAVNMEKMGPIQVKALPTRKTPIAVVGHMNSQLKYNTEQHEFSYRGSAGTANGFYVDGVKLKNGDLNGIPQSSIQSVTVYAGHIPANYGDATGTIVEIEIKSYSKLYHDWKYPPSRYYCAPSW